MGSIADKQCPTSTWQQVRGTDVPVEKPDVEIDLRTDGRSQEAILNDKEHMQVIHDNVEKLKFGSRTKCIYDDLKKDNMIFSEETSRVIHEMGNMEFFELRQISMTSQCYSCLKHLPEGLKSCPCGACVRPDENTINRIQMRFKALIVPYCLLRMNRSSGKKCGEKKWQIDHWKAKDAVRGAAKHNKNRNPSMLDRWMTDEQY